MMFIRSTTLKPIVAITALFLLTAANGEGCSIHVEGLEESDPDAGAEVEDMPGAEEPICPPDMRVEEICEGDPDAPAEWGPPPGEEPDPEQTPELDGPYVESGPICFWECVPDVPHEGEDDGMLDDDCDDHAETPEDDQSEQDETLL